MRALTLIRPWDFAILNGKNVENRPWKPWQDVIGQRIAIHAGSKYDRDAERFILKMMPLPSSDGSTPGVVVGIATVAGWVFKEPGADIGDFIYGGEITANEAIGAVRSPWFLGPYGWVLRDARALREPVPCKGALGLWNLPPDVEWRVASQLSEVA